MKTFSVPINLEETLEFIQIENPNYSDVCDLLFRFGYDDFDKIFHVGEKKVENETYQRIPIYQGNCVAILMIWGIDNMSAIHDHGNYDGYIKVLKGELTEVSYRENSNFIEYDGATTAHTNDSFPEDLGGIHSIVNNSEEPSVSLHIYRTQQINLEGVRIFDTENRKIAWLSHQATSCSWKLPTEAYAKVINI